MFEYELQQIRSAELIREAEHYRQVREARRARREAARDAEERDTQGQAPRSRMSLLRFSRAA
ncbi:hypothetical protein [Streptomyces adelaidensis]|uniref:hypothetical protein n=1 Tax=Streptomyces adelaidensis TaxID=2796465 RepID=UPI001F210FDB|nr:hypothetical protein [Streptomyces adelaidensis]